MAVQCLYKLGLVAYFEINRDYIAEVLCIKKDEPMNTCHGQCFLKKNLDLGVETTPDDTRKPIGKERIEFPIFLLTENAYEVRQPPSASSKNPHRQTGISSDHISSPFHPPCLLC